MYTFACPLLVRAFGSNAFHIYCQSKKMLTVKLNLLTSIKNEKVICFNLNAIHSTRKINSLNWSYDRR